MRPPPSRGARSAPWAGPPEPRTTGDRIADIAFDADFEYYQSLGSNVQNVVNDIESLMNAIEGIYEFNTDISYEETVFVVRTAEPDPYTSTNPNTLLDQFDSHWTANLGAIRRDVAHLFTGKEVDGGVIGIAALSTVCSTSSAYGLSQSRYTSNVTLRRSLTAHELGHNWSAQHCNNSGNCNIMCSCNGCGASAGCTGIFTSFGAGEAAQIVAFRNSRSCLTLEPAPRHAALLRGLHRHRVRPGPLGLYLRRRHLDRVRQSPQRPPASPSSTPPAPELTRTTTSAPTSSPSPASPRLSLTITSRRAASPAGKQLFVDVWTSGLRWVNVNTIVSDGVDDTGFTHFNHLLSGVTGAVHAEFRVRFPHRRRLHDAELVHR